MHGVLVRKIRYSFNLFQVRVKTNESRAFLTRVSTTSGNPGKPGKSRKKFPCMEKSWNLKKPE